MFGYLTVEWLGASHMRSPTPLVTASSPLLCGTQHEGAQQTPSAGTATPKHSHAQLQMLKNKTRVEPCNSPAADLYMFKCVACRQGHVIGQLQLYCWLHMRMLIIWPD